MMLTIVGAMTGPLMTRPTDAQLADARAGAQMTVAGGHSVGGVDGGPGVPVTGWSREHGDVRVPHFIGLHAIQALALFARAWGSGGDPTAPGPGRSLQPRRATLRSSRCCSGRRLSGQSFVAPDAPTLAASSSGPPSPSWSSAGSRCVPIVTRHPTRLDGRMSAEQLFSLLNSVTLIAWLALVFLPRVRWTRRSCRSRGRR